MPDPFVTVEDLTALLGRNVTEDQGAVIALDAACDACRTLSGQQFNLDASTVTLDGSGTDSLLLPELPVITVASVSVDGSEVTDWIVRDDGVLIREAPSRWPCTRQSIEVSYIHGYPDGEIPRDVRMVALALASRLVIQGPHLAETSGQQSVRYAIPAYDFTTTEKLILRRHRCG